MVVWCVCVVVVVMGGGGVELMSVNSGLSKISFDSKSFVVIMSLNLISGVFQVTLGNHHMPFTSVSCYCMTSFKVACVVKKKKFFLWTDFIII